MLHASMVDCVSLVINSELYLSAAEIFDAPHTNPSFVDRVSVYGRSQPTATI